MEVKIIAILVKVVVWVLVARFNILIGDIVFLWVRKRKSVELMRRQGKLFVTKVVVFYTLRNCKGCELALGDILPVVKKREIPFKLLPLKGSGFDNAPMTCVVDDETGKRDCIEGWNSDFVGDVLKLLDL